MGVFSWWVNRELRRRNQMFELVRRNNCGRKIVGWRQRGVVFRLVRVWVRLRLARVMVRDGWDGGARSVLSARLPQDFMKAYSKREASFLCIRNRGVKVKEDGLCLAMNLDTR